MTATPDMPDPDTTPSSWGVALGKALGATEAVALGRRAETLGFDTVWVSNERFHRDMFTVLGALAMTTDEVRLGTFVSDPYTMHPLVTAAAIATVDELSDGRAMLALGAGGSGFPEMGIEATKPLTDLRTVLATTRALLAGEHASADSTAFTIADAHLATSPRPELPLVLASQSPKMLALGGELADSVMISTFADPRLFQMAVDWAAAGATAAGREFDVGRDVIARIDLSIDDDPSRARDRLRPLIGYLLVLLHPRWWFLETLEIDAPTEIAAIAADRDFAAMSANLDLIPDELIDAFGWCGAPGDVASSLARLEELGVRRFVALPHAAPGGIGDTIDALAEIVGLDRRTEAS